MKNAIILHGTDFDKGQKESSGNWFPWLKKELENIGYEVWLPELPQAWKPNIERYWEFLKDFNFYEDTLLVGHSSGGAAILGILNNLPQNKKVKLAILVAGFYKDEGWDCEGLFTKQFDWDKIKKQSEKILLFWSPNDPHIGKEQTDYLSDKLHIAPIIIENQKHFSVAEMGEKYRQFPELLKTIVKVV